MECNRPGLTGVVASAGVCDAFSVLACGQAHDARPAGRRKACARPRHCLQAGGRAPIGRFGFARARPGTPAQAGLDHRSNGACLRPLARRGQSGYPAIQVRSAHPDRWSRERLPAAERRAQRGTQRARCRGRDQSGPVVVVARSCARNHQEEQARRAAGIRSGAAGRCAGEIPVGPVRNRPRSVLADAGRARAGCLLRSVHRLCGG